jgi:hypothetical protein
MPLISRATKYGWFCEPKTGRVALEPPLTHFRSDHQEIPIAGYQSEDLRRIIGIMDEENAVNPSCEGWCEHASIIGLTDQYTLQSVQPVLWRLKTHFAFFNQGRYVHISPLPGG